MEEKEQVSLKIYLVIFLLSYIGSIILLVMLQSIFDKILNGMEVVIVMTCAQITMLAFLKREKRPPNNGEKRGLIWGSLSIVIIITLSFIGMAIIMPDVFGDISTPKNNHADQWYVIVTSITLFIFIIDLFLLNWIYGSFARRQYLATIKYGKKKREKMMSREGG